MPAGEGQQAKDALEKSAVRVSFWLGGVGLVSLKGVAYLISGSALIRAAMFESMGDVISSAIMAVTQWKVADTTDRHLYPAGKHRLTPLGILFFCAFMTSAMASVAIEALSSLFAPEEEPPEGPGNVLKRALEEHPHLRGSLLPQQVDDIVSSYSASDEDESGQSVVLIMLCLGVAAKCICFIWCTSASSRGSEIAKTLRMDHGNDIISNSMIALIMVILQMCEVRGFHNWWLPKIDPAASFILSIWTIYGWLKEALEQVKALSNHRVEEEELTAVISVANEHLKSGPLELCHVAAYHCGEAFEARLDVSLRAGVNLGADEVAAAMAALEQAVRDADCGVCEAHAKLRRARSQSRGGTASTKAPSPSEDMSWVAGYSR